MLSTLFGFKGRLSRIGYLETLLAIALIDVAVFLGAKYFGDYGIPGLSAGLSGAIAAWLPRFFGLMTVWAVIAASVKRCHDRSRTGWLLLLAVIPVIGWIWLLVDLFILKGTDGRNSHGMQPFAHSWDEWQGEDDHATPVAAAGAGAHDSHDSHDSHGGSSLDWTGQGSADHHSGPDPAAALGAYSPPAHVPDDHGHGHDDHGHDDHAHDAPAQAAHDDHVLAAPADHGHDDHDDHGHDDHGHDSGGHDDHHHAPAHA